MSRPSWRQSAAISLALTLVATAPARAQVRHTPTDVQFMRGMIHHHAQAIVMADLVPSRTSTKAIHLLAERITVSQRDEIELMRRWLLDRHEAAPDPGGEQHHGAGADHNFMPGMLTATELARLAAASGEAFDRLFLQFMIKHHEGALTMVRDLFATPGAGQETAIFRFASDVDADQRAEIARMRALLGA